jgi:hypothetical protein
MYLHACKPNAKRDAKKDRSGNSNIVALYRRTRKGQYQHVNGQDLGVAGVNGSDYYEIRIGVDGVLYCSCPDYKFRGHKWNRTHESHYACKHIAAALAHFATMAQRGISMDSEMIVYKPEALVAEAVRIAAAAAAAAATKATRTA